MDVDRTKICEIISEMLDNPGEHEIYPTTVCYDKLEKYVEGVRAEAIGWAHADDCADLDAGRDPRKKEVPCMLACAETDLA